MHKWGFAHLLSTAAAVAILGTGPAMAQEAGDSFARVAAARTKLIDKGEVRTNGVLDPAADYKTRETFHGEVTLG